MLSCEDILKVAEKVLETFGRVDFLVNGAGGNHLRATVTEKISFFDLSEDGVKIVFDLNFWNIFCLAKSLGKSWPPRTKGSF